MNPLHKTVPASGAPSETFQAVTVNSQAIIPSNIEVDNAEAIFYGIPTDANRRYYQCSSSDDPTSLEGKGRSHFKGIASFLDKLIFTHTNLYLFGGGGNGKYMIANKTSDGDLGSIDATFDTSQDGWSHPCSAQACGSYMAMGIQQTASGSGPSEIRVYDIRNAQDSSPIVQIGAIVRSNDGINGVAITKEIGPSGKYIVAGVNGSSLTIYRSSTSSLDPSEAPPFFTVVLQDDHFEQSGAGLALVSQTDGAIYLFTLNDDDSGGNSVMGLYRLELGTLPTIRLVDTRSMPIPGVSDSITDLQGAMVGIAIFDAPLALLLEALLALGTNTLNSSFRWGKGLAITSPTSVELYATDRNILPNSRIPVVPSRKDFSLVVWSGGIAPDGTLLRQSSGAVWVIFGSARFHVPDPGTLNRLYPNVPMIPTSDPNIDSYSLVPRDETLLREENGNIWVVFGGAGFHIPDPGTLTRLYDPTKVRQVWNGALTGNGIGPIPEDGTLLREVSSTQVYRITGGHRVIATGFPPDKVRVVWDGALAQIP